MEGKACTILSIPSLFNFLSGGKRKNGRVFIKYCLVSRVSGESDLPGAGRSGSSRIKRRAPRRRSETLREKVVHACIIRSEPASSERLLLGFSLLKTWMAFQFCFSKVDWLSTSHPNSLFMCSSSVFDSKSHSFAEARGIQIHGALRPCSPLTSRPGTQAATA